jgi:beta-mannosidase
MELVDSWEVAEAAPGAFQRPHDLGQLQWCPAQVPGTAAAAVGVDGRNFDAQDWWFRARFAAPECGEQERVMLELDGVATVSEVYLNGEPVLESQSMWSAHRVDVTTRLGEDNELVIVCRALAPLLARRRRPAARWRTRVVNEGNLRWYRTMMFGRSPGFAPGPAPVGPWRPVRVVARGPLEVHTATFRPRVDNADGVVRARVHARSPVGRVQLRVGGERAVLQTAQDGWLEGEVRVPDVERWWPHTHGDPVLYEAELVSEDATLVRRAVGFRTLAFAPDIPTSGLDLRVNDVPIFVRGAVWTPMDLVSLAPTARELRRVLETLRDAGMNMLRVVGTGAYESLTFHDLCDELGILVWQDLMFSNLDYPTEDPEFRRLIDREAREEIGRVAGRPSLAVVCGNSEVEQQPAMMGLDPGLGRGPFWEHALPGVVAESGADCAYVRSTPCGGDLPFHPDQGITHYFAVSGYFAEPAAARRSEVRFAAECLAFANVPDVVEVPVHHPRWKAGVPRDAGTGWDLGAGWDFDDVRDFYLGLLYRVDPVQLRRSDLVRYLELSRAASGEVMAEVMGDWRRPDSPCQGALVLWSKDMLEGAGLGILDHRGHTKVVYHYLRRALAPIAVWTSDEGVAGVAVHVANDRPQPLLARLRVALYRDGEACVAEVEESLELGPHSYARRTVEGMLGRFVDAAWAYRFGPPAQDVIVATIDAVDQPQDILSQAFRFPAGLPKTRGGSGHVGLEAVAHLIDEQLTLTLRTAGLAYGVRIDVPGFLADDDAFSVEPGRERRIRLRPEQPGARCTGGTVSALNLDATVRVEAP